MSEPFIGEIRPFAFTYAPRSWAVCAGQILPIAQNQALFSLLGTTYGGDGQSTFSLPNLLGRAALGFGTGPGLENYAQGQVGGTATVTLIPDQLPSHTHLPQVSVAAGNRRDPFPIPPGVGHRWAGSDHAQYAAAGPDVAMAAGLVGFAGSNQPHENQSPFLAINYCIALTGIYPSRN